MARTRLHAHASAETGSVIPLTPDSGWQEPKAQSGVDGPPNTDMESYDRTLKEVFELQELTHCKGWTRFFGSLLSEAADATRALESCEKLKDMIRCQATLALVKAQKAKLRQPAEDLSGLRGRYPLFAQDFPYRADFDEATGCVSVVVLGPEGEVRATPNPGWAAGKAPPPGSLGELLEDAPGPEPGDPFDD